MSQSEAGPHRPETGSKAMVLDRPVRTVGILLAAGASRRFGPGDKLLAPLRGRPLVHWSASALQDSACQRVAAIVSSHEVEAALPPGFVVRHVPPLQSMARSFRAAVGLAEKMSAERALICLGDMPAITAGLLGELLARRRNSACRSAGRRLPPVLLYASSYRSARESARADAGARDFIARLPAEDLLEIGEESAADVDTVSDLRFLGRGF